MVGSNSDMLDTTLSHSTESLTAPVATKSLTVPDGEATSSSSLKSVTLLSAPNVRPSTVRVDDVLISVTTFGNYQMMGALVILLFEVIYGANMLNPFLAAEPEHLCYVPQPSFLAGNMTLDWDLLVPIAIDIRGDYTFHPCLQYKPIRTKEDLEQALSTGPCNPWKNLTKGCSSNRTVIPCQGDYIYESEYGLTLVNDFELVCQRGAYLGDLLVACFYMGDLIGALLFPTFGDVYGRRNTFLLCTFMAALPFGILASMMATPVTYGIMKLMSGLFMSGAFCVGSTLISELFPDSQALTVHICEWMSNSLSVGLLTVLAYWARDWRGIQLLITAPLLLVFLLGIFVLPESLHFLLADKQWDRTRDWVKRAAYANNVVVRDHILNAIKYAQQADENIMEKERSSRLIDDSNKRMSFSIQETTSEDGVTEGHFKPRTMDLIKSRDLRLRTLVLTLLFGFSNIIYYGVILTSELLPGDRYIIFLLMGVTEIPIIGLTRLFITCCKPRTFASFLYLLCALTFLAVPLLPVGHEISLLRTAFFILGKIIITAAMATTFNIAWSSFPLHLRAAGTNICAVGSRIGTCLASCTVTLARLSYKPQPIIYGALALIASIIIWGVPNITKKKKNRERGVNMTAKRE